MPDKVHKAKVYSILNQGKALTLLEQLNVIYDDNAFLLLEFAYVLLIVLIIWISYKKVYKWSDEHIRREFLKGNAGMTQREMGYDN